MVLTCWAAGRKAENRAAEERRKADYVFMEALRQNALEKPDAYFELLSRAHRLDPEDTETGLDLGYYYAMLAGDDSLMMQTGFDMMRRHFDTDPHDYYGSIFYGTICQRLGEPDEALRVWHILDSINPDRPDVAIRYGESLMESGDTANVRRAIDVFDRLERTEGKDLGLTSHKVRANYFLGDTLAIYRELEDLIKYSPRSAANRVYAGDVYRAMSMPDSAIASYNAACAIDSTNGLAYYSRANFYLERGDTIGYDREIYEALRQSGLDSDTKIELLKTYARDMIRDTVQRPRINELFGILIDQQPHDIDLRDLYSGYFIATQQYAEAAEQMSYTLDLNPADEDRWRTLIGMYMQAKMYDEAVKSGYNALHYYPESSTIYMLTGANESMIDRYDDALHNLQKAFDTGADRGDEYLSEVLCTMGDTYYKSGKKDEAFEYYERSLELDPQNYLSMNNCAYFLACEERDLDRAETLSAEAVRVDPENPTSLDTYAWVFFKKKEYAKALDYINRALDFDEDPGSEELDHAGDINFMNGNRDEAIDFWQQALELDPDNDLIRRKVRMRTILFE